MATSTLLPLDVWRRSSHGLITPPMSTAFVSLPPITHFDRRPTQQCLPPVTPPWTKQRYDDEVDVFEPPFQHKPFIPDDAPHLIDWFDSTLKRPASFIAEKTCEMVCYLWFSSPSPSSHFSSSQQIPSPPYSPEIPATTSPLQLAPSAAFVQFMHKLLETTQVSQSVIVLSLHYIWRLKERNRFTNGLPGSEFRIAVAALMMANKFLDDNTYTNKTWSEVSGIDLSEIHKMEREFLTAVDFSLHVSGKQYASWLNLLKGLVLAKETESRKWRGIRARYSRHGRQSQPMSSVPVARTYRLRCQSSSHRARSTSPLQLTNPPASAYHVTPPQHAPSPSSGTKRSAADAFSPTSTSFKELPPLKRPTGMTLQIPDTNYANCQSSGSSPLDSLYSFAKMTLSSSPHAQRAAQSQQRSNVIEGHPQTLVAAYRADRPVNVPESLYYYSLAGSSINGDSEQPKGNRKARLRCFQPAPQPPPSYTVQPPPYVPMDVQSASVSPHDSHVTLGVRQPSLPHLHDAIWARKLSSTCGTARSVSAHMYMKLSPVDRDQSLQLPPLRGDGSCVIPSAPFANAGPPGVQFYTTASTPACQHPHPYHHQASHHRGSPVYPSPQTWAYAR
ncbi:cyclin-domain-containing protein [Pisolithus orientalis]|uniref:cyclin-domain-containing protein n=1 Tax=Pisolithus orientalis TaxID=936130 RepID=UPI00222590CD|nr:cyclin-domain-containing protein [Pisolithus orientalis]KAI5994608.1 cyclin-domain-containing protein [Pisolithus orientalis]